MEKTTVFGDTAMAAARLLTWAPPILATTPGRLAALASVTPSELIRRRPAQDAWSPAETLHHLLDIERLGLPARIRAMREGATELAAIDQNAIVWDLSRDSNDIAAEFGRIRTETLEMIATLVPTDLDRRANHSAFGEVTLGQQLHYLVAHDFAHLQQIERGIMQPFVGGAGPWANNVADLIMR